MDLCKRLIAVNSVTVPNGTKEIVQFLLPIFRDMNCEVKTQSFDIEGHENFNLLARLGPPASTGALLINTHLDTVPPGPHEAWTLSNNNPFQATIHQDNLIGLGSSDTKLAMACVMTAMRNVLSRKPAKFWRAPLYVMGAAGEERGLLGTHYALRHDFVKAQYVLDSEPSELNLVWAHKGIAVARILIHPRSASKVATEVPPKGELQALRFSGTAAHSSTPHLGDNALEKACLFLEWLDTHPLEAWKPYALNGGTSANVIPSEAMVFLRAPQGAKSLKSALQNSPLRADIIEQVAPTAFTTPECLMAVAHLRAGLGELSKQLAARHEPDFVPPHATASFTVARTLPGPAEKPDPFIELLIDYRFVHAGDDQTFFLGIQNAAANAQKRFPNLVIHAEPERANQPMQGRRDSFLVKTLVGILQQMGLPGTLRTKSGCTEGALFAAHGMETVVIGPGISENNIHKPNERVPVKQLHQAVTFYERTIEHFCV